MQVNKNEIKEKKNIVKEMPTQNKNRKHFLLMEISLKNKGDNRYDKFNESC